MSAGLGGLVLAIGTAGWMVLPLLPTLHEFFRKTDDQPFEIIQENPFNPTHFADVLTARLQEIRHEIALCSISGLSTKGYFKDGGPYRIAARAESLSAAVPKRAVHSTLILCSPGFLSNGSRFSEEVYAAGSLTGGITALFTSILCDGTLELGRASTVLKWAHSRSDFRVGEDCVLRGRITSEALLQIEPGTTFERLHARRIRFGSAAAFWDPSDGPAVPRAENSLTVGAPSTRKIIEGDLEITSGCRWDGDLVVKGRLIVDAGSLIQGNLKSYGNMQIGQGAVILGSIVSARNIEFLPGCAVLGPAISEAAVFFRSGCRIGTEDRPTTVTAMRITAAPGAAVFGTVWAREKGYVEN
jgi:hypothetical protein